MWRKGDLCTLLVEMYIGAATKENKTSGYWLPSLRKHYPRSLSRRLFSGNGSPLPSKAKPSPWRWPPQIQYMGWAWPGFPQLGLGRVVRDHSGRCLSTPPLGAHTPCELSLGLSSFSTCPSGPPSSREGLSHPWGPQDWDAQPGAWPAASPVQAQSRFSSEPPPGNRGPSCHFSSPAQWCAYLSFSFGCRGVLC